MTEWGLHARHEFGTFDDEHACPIRRESDEDSGVDIHEVVLAQHHGCWVDQTQPAHQNPRGLRHDSTQSEQRDDRDSGPRAMPGGVAIERQVIAPHSGDQPAREAIRDGDVITQHIGLEQDVGKIEEQLREDQRKSDGEKPAEATHAQVQQRDDERRD